MIVRGSFSFLNARCYLLYAIYMRIKVKAIAHASRDAIEKLREGEYKVWVRAIPEKGKANEAIRRVLGLEFGVPISRVRLASGGTSGQKVFDIDLP